MPSTNSQFPLSEAEIEAMLKVLGRQTLDELFAGPGLRDVIVGPEQVTLPADRAPFPPPLGDFDLLAALREKAARTKGLDRLAGFLGGGAYHHFIPPAVDFLTARGEFFTAYTPYQSEASQGTLQAIFEYQTMIARLTGMQIANASLYDGATATAEAAIMAVRAGKGPRRVAVSHGVNPRWRRVLETYLTPQGIEITELAVRDGVSQFAALDDEAFWPVSAVVVQTPNYLGVIEDLEGVAEKCHTRGALLIVAVYPPALGMITPPGEWGADIACGEGQPLGQPLSFGGPFVGLLACRDELKRLLPGRIVGETVDRNGRRAFTMTLRTREQDIRREKATSNICTNQALCALRATVFMALLGEGGFRRWSLLIRRQALRLRRALASVRGVTFLNDAPFFNEFVYLTPLPAVEVLAALRERGIAGGLPLGDDYRGLDNGILTCATELNTDEQIDRYRTCLSELLN
ncbi:MAG: aminomethyl-transferring glycine dehydrogenase subunit GcvPA [Candidatus Sumerlaeia bacterium]